MENKKLPYLLGIIRISLGLIFTWAFLDKFFGLGISTQPEKAWISGGSPTFGYLQFGVSGPLADFYRSIAGQPLVDWLFMLGMFFVGVALVLGVMVRLGGIFGIMLMLLIYSSNLPPANNPIIDQHLIYVLVLLLLMAANRDQQFGFGERWMNLPLVAKNKILE